MELYNEIIEDITELQKKVKKLEDDVFNMQQYIKILEDERASDQNGASQDEELYAVYGGD